MSGNPVNQPVFHPVIVTAAKIVDTRMLGIRYQQRGNTQVLQMSHAWSQGNQRGVDWVDVPTVDENGKPV